MVPYIDIVGLDVQISSKECATVFTTRQWGLVDLGQPLVEMSRGVWVDDH